MNPLEGLEGVFSKCLMSTKYENLIGQVIHIPNFPEPVRVINVRPLGAKFQLEGQGYNSGLLRQAVLNEENLESLAVASQNPRFSATLEAVQVGLEAHRIRLGYSFDPHFAVSSSVVDPLPHQLEAVYKYLLPQPRVRFMLADDPGAGKTVMSGLLLKELLFRGALERVLIVTPANLTDQWRREMSEKFHETFKVLNRATIAASYGQNPWLENSRVITSIDFAKREENRLDLEETQWDLIIVDEAHKMTATARPNSDREGEKAVKSDRYRLGEVFSKTTIHLLLLTATPHRGDPEGFRLLLDLIEPGLFATVELLGEAVKAQENPVFLRRLKEDMVGFDGKPLFPPRHPKTITYRLSPTEQQLYEAVTAYVTEHFAKAFTLRKRNVGFAMTVLQRRLTSSIYAIHRSLKARHSRLTRLREEAVNVSILSSFDPDLPENLDDLSEEEVWQIEEELLEKLTLARNLPELDAEISALKKLVEQSEFHLRLNQERKLEELKRVMSQLLVNSNGERLLIFTEHKDTLDYLKGKISEWGYSVTSIDGSMALEERIAAEREFRDAAQVMVATEAAGEGINLQFCHLMVNYDLPWNPNRLEQRMGRIHRYGQKLEVYIYNLVASNTREGEVLGKLLSKLEEMRHSMGSERVYDVVGELLNDIDLEELMRQNLAQRVSLEDIKSRIDARLDERVVKSLLANTEVALARQFVNLSVLQKEVEISRLQRLHPEYTERFFRKAFEQLGGQIESRSTHGLYAIPSVPARLRDNHPIARRFGGLPRSYGRIAFDKNYASNLEADLIAPGHPLFEVVLEEALNSTQEAMRLGTTVHLPEILEESVIGFYSLSVQDATGAKVNERLVAVRQAGAVIEPIANHVLLDAIQATPGDTTHEDGELLAYVSDHLLEPFLHETEAARGKNLVIREKYARFSYQHLFRESSRKLARYFAEKRHGKEMDLPIREEERRQERLNTRFNQLTERLQQERFLSLLPPTLLTLARALPAPTLGESDGEAHDPEVERIAMQVAWDYEIAQGRTVLDVSKDGVGYDIYSEQGGLERRHIEVKGRAGRGGVTLYVSEVVMAGRLGDEYYLYIVSNCKTQPTLEIIRNPFHVLGAEVKAVQFQIPLAAWRAVAEPAKA